MGTPFGNSLLHRSTLLPRTISKEHEELWEGYPFIRLPWDMQQEPVLISEITEKIEQYLRAESISELYSYALEQLEQLHGEELVREVFSALWESQKGLTLHEIVETSHQQVESAEEVISAVSNHLVWDKERMHLSAPVRTAVEERYLFTAEQQRTTS